MEILTLDREDFRLWLASKEPDDIVGTEELCPGDCWLLYSLSLPDSRDASVTYEDVEVHGHNVPTLDWLARFANALDTHLAQESHEGWSAVTAKEALEALDSLDVGQQHQLALR